MLNRWSYVLLSFVAATVIFVSCKPKSSPDDVLPTVYSPNVIIGSDNQVLYALDPTTGAKSWELGLPCPIIASPLVYNGSVYIASSKTDTIYKINSRTGSVTKKITFANGNAGVKATPIADANLLYVAGISGGLFAIDTGSGVTKWSFSANGSMESSPVLYDGSVYISTTTGYIYRFGKTYGNSSSSSTAGVAATWAMNLPGAKFVSSPAIASPYLFVGSVNDSAVYCVYLDCPTNVGVKRWAYKTQGGVRSSPTIYGGYCIFGCDDFKVYCIDTGMDITQTQPDKNWITSVKSEVTSSPYAYGQVIYVGCKDYKMYALKMGGGGVKWFFATNGIITSSPLAYNGKVYVGSYDKYLYAVDTARGTLLWKTNVNGQIECSPTLDDLTKLTGNNSGISGYVN